MVEAPSESAVVDELAVDDDGEGGGEGGGSFWQKIGGALGRAAAATGRVARAGYDNRNYVSAVINGAIGDKLARNTEGLAIRMSLRDAGSDVRPRQLDGVAGHVAVFVHGLMADESTWTRPFGGFEGLGPMLAREHGLTPLLVRYNSGLHISENGRILASLLADLVEAHPEIDRLTLVGHSMGGLVVRSATHYGGESQHDWPRLVDTIVLLGAPNDGAYLEQAAHLATRVLETLPWLTTDIIAGIAHARSDGIKDLRLGLLVCQDWQRPGADTMRLADRTHVPLMPGVHYCVATATLAESADSIVATYLGDGLVGGKSALATGDDHGAASIRCRVFTKTAHLALVSHPEIQQFVSDCLSPH